MCVSDTHTHTLSYCVCVRFFFSLPGSDDRDADKKSFRRKKNKGLNVLRLKINAWRIISYSTQSSWCCRSFLDANTRHRYSTFPIKYSRQDTDLWPASCLPLAPPPLCPDTQLPPWFHFLYRGYFSSLGFPSSLSARHPHLLLFVCFLSFHIAVFLFFLTCAHKQNLGVSILSLMQRFGFGEPVLNAAELKWDEADFSGSFERS